MIVTLIHSLPRSCRSVANFGKTYEEICPPLFLAVAVLMLYLNKVDAQAICTVEWGMQRGTPVGLNNSEKIDIFFRTIT